MEQVITPRQRDVGVFVPTIPTRAPRPVSAKKKRARQSAKAAAMGAQKIATSTAEFLATTGEENLARLLEPFSRVDARMQSAILAHLREKNPERGEQFARVARRRT